MTCQWIHVGSICRSITSMLHLLTCCWIVTDTWPWWRRLTAQYLVMLGPWVLELTKARCMTPTLWGITSTMSPIWPYLNFNSACFDMSQSHPQISVKTDSPHYDILDSQITQQDRDEISIWYHTHAIFRFGGSIQMFKVADFFTASDVIVWRFKFESLDEQALFKLTFSQLWLNK